MPDTPDLLQTAATRHAGRPAVVEADSRLRVNWFTLDDLTHTWLRRLRQEGVEAGHRVVVVEPAGVRFASLLFACLRLGAAMVPVSPRAPRVEHERVLADARPRAIVQDGAVVLRDGAARGDPDDAFVLYTSGTTGPPKGVRQTLANHLASLSGCQAALGTGDQDRWLLMLQPHHVGGLAMFLRAAAQAQPVIVVPRFEETAVLQALRQYRPTLVSAVPTMLTRLVAAGGTDLLRRLRVILLGGAPAPRGQLQQWLEAGLPISASYGLTETTSQITIVPPGRGLELLGTAGVVNTGAGIDILPRPDLAPADDPDPGSVGEIVVGGPVVSPGYVNPAIPDGPGGGRFRTGDLGRLHDGVLTVLGRIDDAIVTGGENVQPEEVEAVLRAHPSVVDAAVAGRPDHTWGELVTAWVVAGRVSDDELEAWCRDHLAPAKVPRRWRRVASIPRTEGGKLRRRELPDEPM
ncbi:MAG: AMP-binding protein [Candidatus Dormibacteraeota bacterium]|nr:AMP-binding protein [Candidatus Dormibacteraeota bacterium]